MLRRDRGRAPHADRLTRQASFAEEVARAEHRHDGFSARLREHRQLHAALLDVQDVSQASPWAKMTVGSPVLARSFLRPRAESRNAWALNVDGSASISCRSFNCVSTEGLATVPVRGPCSGRGGAVREGRIS